MKAIRIVQAGDAQELKLQDIPAPAYGDDDVVVQMKVAGLNYIDIYTRTGLYKPAQYPYTPGKEGSGVIIACGKNVKDIKVGDRVAFCSAGTGTFAEVVVIPASQVVIIPDEMSFEIAAAVMLQGLTAYYLSHLTYAIKKNDTVLIHAGAGGVGLLLIQLAKMLGAKVITTVSTDDKANLVKNAGADHVILYTQESFYAATMAITKNLGVSVVYDAVGKTTFDDSLKSLAVRGMLVTYGQASGPIPAFELSKLAAKSLYLTRPSLTSYTSTQDELRDMAKKLFTLILQDKLHITIGQRYSLAEAWRAHADLEERKTIGKSVILIST